MNRLLPKLLLLMLSAMVAMPGNAETELAGYWQHESEPVWIEMQPDTGKGFWCATTTGRIAWVFGRHRSGS